MVTRGKQAVCDISYLQGNADSCRPSQICLQPLPSIDNSWQPLQIERVLSSSPRNPFLFRIAENWRLSPMDLQQLQIKIISRNIAGQLQTGKKLLAGRVAIHLSCREKMDWVKLSATVWVCLLTIGNSCKVPAIPLQDYENLNYCFMFDFHWSFSNGNILASVCKNLQESAIVCNCLQFTARKKCCRQPVFSMWP